jgi:flagellin-like protein
MKVIKNNRGLSPVIATVLLIAIAMVLAVIIFIWASSFISENVEKFGEPVENSCNNVMFRAEADESSIYIVNEGNVPLYGLEVNVRSKGGVSSAGLEYDETGKSILSGAGSNAQIDLSGSNIKSGEELVLVPIILGESNDGKIMHVCDNQFGVLTEVV